LLYCIHNTCNKGKYPNKTRHNKNFSDGDPYTSHGSCHKNVANTYENLRNAKRIKQPFQESLFSFHGVHLFATPIYTNTEREENKSDPAKHAIAVNVGEWSVFRVNITVPVMKLPAIPTAKKSVKITNKIGQSLLILMILMLSSFLVYIRRKISISPSSSMVILEKMVDSLQKKYTKMDDQFILKQNFNISKYLGCISCLA
jgi:hypothetical protein